MNETPLARKIKECLNQNGMKYHDLAERSGVSESTIRQFLAGFTRNPTQKTITKFADALGVTVDFLLASDDVPSNRTTTPEEFDLLQDWRGLDLTAKNMLMEQIRLFKETSHYNK